MYFVYMMRCADGSLYSRSGRETGSRYTRSHPVIAMAALWQVPDRSKASRLEYRLKQLGKQEKERLCRTPAAVTAYFPEALPLLPVSDAAAFPD